MIEAGWDLRATLDRHGGQMNKILRGQRLQGGPWQPPHHHRGMGPALPDAKGRRLEGAAWGRDDPCGDGGGGMEDARVEGLVPFEAPIEGAAREFGGDRGGEARDGQGLVPLPDVDE